MPLIALPKRPAPNFVVAGITVLIVGLFVAFATVGTTLALRNPLLAGAGLGALAVIYIAWRWPAVSLAIIFASAPWTADISQGAAAKFSIGEAVLVLSIPAFYAHSLIRKKLPSGGPILVPIFLYLSICVFSSAVHWVGKETLVSLLQMFLYLVVAVVVFARFTAREEDLLLALYSLVASGVVLALYAIATNYTCFGSNKNSIGDPLASSFLVCVILLLSSELQRRTRVLLVSALIVLTLGLFFSLSRGSWLGACLGLLVITILKREHRRMGYILLAVLPLIVLGWTLLPAKSRAYAFGFSTDRYNIKARLLSVDIAEVYYQRNPLYGYGVGLRKDFDATNLVMVTLAETGWLGLSSLMLVHIVFFYLVWKTQRRVDKSEPMHALLCVGAALILARLSHGMVDHYWTRGVLMLAWGGAGMTMSVYFAAHTRQPLAHKSL